MPYRVTCPTCGHRDARVVGRCTHANTATTMCGCVCTAVAEPRPPTDRLPPQSQTVLAAIRAGRTWGTAIIDHTGMSMTAVYRTLRQLRDHGVLLEEAEPTVVAAAERRPRRVLYRIPD